MAFKITTLIENTPDCKSVLKYEHGLSLYIEYDGKKILFDTGQTGAFLDNAESLGKDMEVLDAMIISHGHYDHSGGMKRFLKEVAEKPKLYVGKEFFDPKHKRLEDGTFKFNGNAFTKEKLIGQGIEVIEVTENITYITPKIILFKGFKRVNKFEKLNEKFYVKKDNQMILDPFNDELVLALLTEQGVVVIAGCSHRGIINILEAIRGQLGLPIYAVIGGTHLVEADELRIDETINTFKQMKIKKIAVSHCTGEMGIKRLQQAFKEQFINNNTGNVLLK